MAHPEYITHLVYGAFCNCPMCVAFVFENMPTNRRINTCQTRGWPCYICIPYKHGVCAGPSDALDNHSNVSSFVDIHVRHSSNKSVHFSVLVYCLHVIHPQTLVLFCPRTFRCRVRSVCRVCGRLTNPILLGERLALLGRRIQTNGEIHCEIFGGIS